MNLQTTTLNNGIKMPVLGYGVFRVENGAELAEAVKTAIKKATVVLILHKFMAMKKW